MTQTTDIGQVLAATVNLSELYGQSGHCGPRIFFNPRKSTKRLECICIPVNREGEVEKETGVF